MTKHHDYFPMPRLSSRIMRQMQPGDVVYVDAGHRVRTQKNLYQNQVNATARAKLLKMEVATRIMYLFDPKDPDNFNMEPIVAIYCKTVAAPLRKRGRRVKETVETPEPDAVSGGDT